jgi:hypothetical protein
MQSNGQISASDSRLGAYVMSMCAAGFAFFALKTLIGGNIAGTSCEPGKYWQFCELGRSMLLLLPPGMRHFLVAASLAGMAGLFGWLALQSLRRAEAMERCEGKDGAEL